MQVWLIADSENAHAIVNGPSLCVSSVIDWRPVSGVTRLSTQCQWGDLPQPTTTLL